MVTETISFSIYDVRWLLRQQGDPVGEGITLAAPVSGIRSVAISCNACTNNWIATEGEREGQFQSIADALWMSCPACGAEDSVPISSVR